MKTKFFLSVFTLIISLQLLAQPKRQLVKVIVTPDKTDWTYEVGERAEFTITVLKNNEPIDGLKVNYKIQPEKMDVWDEGTLTIKDGSVKIKAGKFKEPGFYDVTHRLKLMGKHTRRMQLRVFRLIKLSQLQHCRPILKSFGIREKRIWQKYL